MQPLHHFSLFLNLNGRPVPQSNPCSLIGQKSFSFTSNSKNIRSRRVLLAISLRALSAITPRYQKVRNGSQPWPHWCTSWWLNALHMRLLRAMVKPAYGFATAWHASSNGLQVTMQFESSAIPREPAKWVHVQHTVQNDMDSVLPEYGKIVSFSREMWWPLQQSCCIPGCWLFHVRILHRRQLHNNQSLEADETKRAFNYCAQHCYATLHKFSACLLPECWSQMCDHH